MENCREEWYDAERKVSVTVADVTAAANALVSGHLAGPTSARFLSEALAAAALFGAETSEQDEVVSLQMKCSGVRIPSSWRGSQYRRFWCII